MEAIKKDRTRNLLFDMGGVVTLQDAAEARRRFEAMGVDGSMLSKHGHRGVFGALEEGSIGTQEFCRQLALMAGREQVSYAEAEYCWMGFKRDAPMDRLLRIEALKSRYHVCLVSNTNPFVFGRALTEGFCETGRPITDFFHSVFVSYELGVCKPSSAYYNKVLQADGMLAEECIFIDDSMENVRAAEALGMRGLHVATNEDWGEQLAEMLAEEE